MNDQLEPHKTPPPALRRYVSVHKLVLAIGACLGFSHSADAVSDENAALRFNCNGCDVLSREELMMRRGGFRFAGLEFDFGANIRSYIDNQLVLESLITITNEGTNQVTNVPLPASAQSRRLESTAAGGLPATQEQGSSSVGDTLPVRVDGAEITQPVQSQAVAAQVPAMVDLAGVSDALGVSVNDRKGFTSVLHQATRERITSLVVNTASGRDIRQELDVTVNVRNFVEFQKAARQAILSNRIGAAQR